MNLAVLIPAVLTCARSQGGSVTKTKLLKLLYLFDIESFRQTRTTLTGFSWIFYKYGPWAPEYDPVLDELQGSDVIALHAGTKIDLDMVFVDATRPVQFSIAFPSAVEEIRARRIIEAWADRPTGELLDYVYFHTAPMREARRGEPLDFNAVLEEEPAPDYKRTNSAVADRERKKRQREFRKSINEARATGPAPIYIEPRFDGDFWRAVEILDRDPN
jgi:Protein of unknown function (DUF4065)